MMAELMKTAERIVTADTGVRGPKDSQWNYSEFTSRKGNQLISIRRDRRNVGLIPTDVWCTAVFEAIREVAEAPGASEWQASQSIFIRRHWRGNVTTRQGRDISKLMQVLDDLTPGQRRMRNEDEGLQEPKVPEVPPVLPAEAKPAGKRKWKRQKESISGKGIRTAVPADGTGRAADDEVKRKLIRSERERMPRQVANRRDFNRLYGEDSAY